VRQGRALRQVARAAGVSLSTVQLWVGRAQHRRLDEVDWADRSSRPRRTSRSPRPFEDLALQVRQELRDISNLGEFGAQYAVSPVPRTVGRTIRQAVYVSSLRGGGPGHRRENPSQAQAVSASAR
jgi:transposase